MGLELMISKNKLSDIGSDSLLHLRIKHFDSEFYRTHGHFDGYADLIDLTYDELLLHFIRRGYLERRSYNRYFYSYIDGDFYKKKYPELNLQSSEEAVFHWNYFGAFENRIPNCVTDDLIKSSIHLFQMGKIGSKSIQKALVVAGHSQLIPHLHFASEILQTYPDCFYTYNEVINLSTNPILFVSGVREPISRIISGIIESSADPKSSITIESVFELINNREKLEDHIYKDSEIIINWFDHKYYSNIDIYKYGFDKNRGYQEYKGDKHRVFVYRYDKLSHLWSRLSEACSLSLESQLENISSENNPQAQYIHDKICKTGISVDLLEKIYKSKYCQYFFTDDEISEFKIKYSV